MSLAFPSPYGNKWREKIGDLTWINYLIDCVTRAMKRWWIHSRANSPQDYGLSRMAA